MTNAIMIISVLISPIGWGHRIYQLHFCRGVSPTSTTCPGYDIKQSNGEALALEILEMWTTSSLPLLPGQLWPKVVVPDRVK